MVLCYRENYKEGAKQLDIQAGMIGKTPFHLTYVRYSKTVFDIKDSFVGFWNSLSVELGFQIPVVSGIPDFLS